MRVLPVKAGAPGAASGTRDSTNPNPARITQNWEPQRDVFHNFRVCGNTLNTQPTL